MLETTSMRLDRYLSEMGKGTRSEVKKYIRQGRVLVNDKLCSKSDYKVELGRDHIKLDGISIEYIKNVYYMLNKPQGVISATRDSSHRTVIDLIDNIYGKELFPVGRLDIDTEGLLIITNDGSLAHNLLSPKKEIGKTYYVEIDGEITQKDKEELESGVYIENQYLTKPSLVHIIESGSISKIELTITEGKFHQVKQMIQAVNKNVVYLKRISMGELKLDHRLAVGEYRNLTEEELLMILK